MNPELKLDRPGGIGAMFTLEADSDHACNHNPLAALAWRVNSHEWAHEFEKTRIQESGYPKLR